MKICLIAPYPPPYGGIANWVKLIVGYIEEHEKKIKIIPINIAPKKRSTDGRRIWDRIFISGFDMIKTYRELIKVDNPDLIHMTTSGQLALIRDILILKKAKAMKIPTVYHIRYGRIPDLMKDNKLEWKLVLYAMKLASKVIVIDKKTYDAINKKEVNIDLELLPNPIDFSILPEPSEKSNGDVIFLGWNIKSKGIEELIKAWNKIGKIYPNHRLRIIGPGQPDYVGYLKSLCTVKNVSFEGEIEHSDALNIVRDCSVFILPSYTEGFPNSVVEAMALKKPIIATRVGAIEEMISDQCGILINFKSIIEIEKSLTNLLENETLRDTCAANAYKKAYENYRVQKVFDNYKIIWKRIAVNNEEDIDEII